MNPLCLYAAGLLTLPALGLLAVVADASWRSAVAALRFFSVHPLRPAWMAYARVAGWNLSFLGRHGGSSPKWEAGFHAIDRQARRALRFPWCPRILWPRYVALVFKLSVMRPETAPKPGGRRTP